MFDFAETTKDMTAAEILNYYRNLYYAEPQVTERGIVANAINDYFKQIAPKTEWISVDERLPEDVYGKYRKQITVLVCTESGKVSTTSRQRIVKFDKDKLEWVELDIFEWSKMKRVTHWMPLPKPPMMEGESK